MNGTQIAVIARPATSAEEVVERLQPNSFVIGSRNMPNVNCMIGPLPTIRPNTEPTTIHQRLTTFILSPPLASPSKVHFFLKGCQPGAFGLLFDLRGGLANESGLKVPLSLRSSRRCLTLVPRCADSQCRSQALAGRSRQCPAPRHRRGPRRHRVRPTASSLRLSLYAMPMPSFPPGRTRRRGKRTAARLGP
jgi:hypothetical protein